jgi:murein DD-endopeptidase MepM/ murein hydrolase activator NlpD
METMRPRGIRLLVLGMATLGVPAAAAATTDGAGGAFASQPATILGVACESGCTAIDAAEAGSVLRLHGRDMADVREVVFLGTAGAADDVTAPALRPRDTSVDVRVPEGAHSGRLLARNGDGAPSAPSGATVAVGEPQPEPDGAGLVTARVVEATRTSDAVDAQVEAHTVYYAGEVSPTLRLAARTGATASLAVALVRVSDGAVVRRWAVDPVAPGVVQSITWDGRAGTRVPARRGRYQFQVWTGSSPSATATGVIASAASADQPPAPEAADTFEFRPYAFPVDGRHTFGEGAAAFGAGRGGHPHQGQDVFADCGTPVVAARGGVVRHKDFQAAAGNYVVIDGDGTGHDTAYMHLRDPAPVDEGDRVATGQVIGAVGDTGHADGCHLHFELWTAPGWYSGGEPVDPLPALKRWE